MTVGERIKQLRKVKGWSRDDLRSAIGKVSYQTVASFELDVVKPSLKMVGKICKVFGLEPEEFFKGVDLY